MNRKNRIANLVMVAVIAAIAAAGILLAGHILGWFDKADEAAVAAEVEQGLANLQRDGLATPLREKTALRDGDVLLTQRDSRVTLTVGDSLVILGGSARVSIKIDTDGSVTLQPAAGELYAEINRTPVNIPAEDRQLLLQDTAAALSFRTGTVTVSVLYGSISADKTPLSSGQSAVFSGGQTDVIPLQANALSDFFLHCAADSTHTLCFTAAQLRDVMDRRQQAQQAALEALSEEEGQQPNDTAGADSGDTAPSDSTPGEVPPAENPSAPPSQGDASQPTPDSGNTSLHCTIEIRCDTILSNMENLEPGKDVYVPASGTILSTTRVAFSEGETVFDVLKRACSAAGLQIEYSYTPMYGSYYIEGINHLYEFDCGNESGWMYQVNGWFPNYGCSEYALSDGDVIVWRYTCSGLGADVGGSIY